MRTRDGIELTAATDEDRVRELHKMSRSPCATVGEFRYEMAGRALLQTGQRVRCDTDENFVADLLKVGLLLDD